MGRQGQATHCDCAAQLLQPDGVVTVKLVLNDTCWYSCAPAEVCACMASPLHGGDHWLAANGRLTARLAAVLEQLLILTPDTHDLQ